MELLVCDRTLVRYVKLEPIYKVQLPSLAPAGGGSYKMRKRDSAKVNMYKMRNFDAKDFAFYTSPF